MEKTIERLVNGNIKVTIPIRLKYDGCKTIIRQPEAEVTELEGRGSSRRFGWPKWVLEEVE